MIIIIIIIITVSASSAFLMTANINCACPGEEVIFTCTAVGGGITVWSGSAFDCSGDTNDISLSHSRFMDLEGISKSCNSGAIVASSVGVTDNRYTSQLSIQVSRDLNGRTIQCAHDSTAGTITTVGTSTLVVANSKFVIVYTSIMSIHACVHHYIYTSNMMEVCSQTSYYQ